MGREKLLQVPELSGQPSHKDSTPTRGLRISKELRGLGACWVLSMSENVASTGAAKDWKSGLTYSLDQRTFVVSTCLIFRKNYRGEYMDQGEKMQAG